MKFHEFIKKYKVELTVITVFFIMLMIVFLPQILSGTAFSYGYDMRHQYFPFFEEFRNQWYNFIAMDKFPNLFSGELPFYSWTMFLGTNFFASKAYYLVGDFYNYLVLPLSNVHYFDLHLILTLVKFSVSALSSFLFLRKFYKKTLPLVAGVIAYAFSFWIIYYLNQPMFASFYSLIPLYFLGMESYLQDKKKILFIIMTTLLACINYYFFYTLSVFSVMYFTYRYACLGKEWKKFFKEAIVLVGYYLVGVLMAMIILLPAALYIVDSHRVGSMETSLLYPDIRVYMNMIGSFFMPRTEVFTAFTIYTYRFDALALWSGTLTTLLVPQFLSDEDKKFRNATLALYLTFFIFYFFPIGGSILHGFSEASFRWLVFVIFMNIWVTSRYLDSLEKINIKNLKITSTIAILITVSIIPLTLILANSMNLWDILIGQFQTAIAYAVLVAVAAWIIIQKKEWAPKGLIIILCLGIFLNRGYYRKDVTTEAVHTWEYTNRISRGFQTENRELIRFLREAGEPVDGLFYRFFIDYIGIYGKYSLNSSIFFGISDLSAYDSTVSPSIYDLMEFQDADFSKPDWMINFKNPGLVNFLSAEYAVVIDEPLPHDNYELIGDYFGLSVYKNLDVVPFGSTYSSVVTYQEIKDKNENTTHQLANHIIVMDPEIKEEIQPYLQSNHRSSIYDVQYSGNSLSGFIETDDSTFMVLQIPYDKGWSILINDQKQKIYRVNGGMMGVVLPKGYSSIKMFFVPQGLKEGILLSGLGGVMFIFLVLQEKKKKKKLKKESRTNA